MVALRLLLLAYVLVCASQGVSGIVPPSLRGPIWGEGAPLRAAGVILSQNRRRIGCGFGVAIATIQLQGFARSAGFWVRAMPIWLRYRRVGWRRKCGVLSQAEADAELDALHERAADDILAAILHLRGAYVKIGQVLSSRPDVIPRAWVDRLSKLQDDVPGCGGEVARRSIKRELGSKSKGLLDSLVDEQIGAAATGQVHRCTVDGKDVCVKVQFPEAKKVGQRVAN